MPSVNDLKRAWLLKMLGIPSSNLSEADLVSLVYGGQTIFKLEGTGSPEGVVTAVVGTEYTDKNATNGAIKWVKKSGTGNTGWEVSVGDTGLRNISSLAYAPAVATATRIRRIGNYVDLVLDASWGTAWVSGNPLISIPQGFRPSGTRYLDAGYPGTSAPPLFFDSVDIDMYSSTTSAGSRWNPSWLTSDPWPTVLPGSAA